MGWCLHMRHGAAGTQTRGTQRFVVSNDPWRRALCVDEEGDVGGEIVGDGGEDVSAEGF